MPDYPHAIASSPGLSLQLLLGSFPIVCFTGALATDIVYANTADMQWTNFSVWLLTGGLVTGGLALFVGVFAHARDRQRGSVAAALVHGVGTISVMLLALWNVLVHSRDGWTSVVPTGLTLSIVTVLLIGATGWLGGMLGQRDRTGLRN